ncbi:MAG: hypothetical protein ACHQ2Y_05490 [Candidatus Lutacidiplasmatales archaeon]
MPTVLTSATTSASGRLHHRVPSFRRVKYVTPAKESKAATSVKGQNGFQSILLAVACDDAPQLVLFCDLREGSGSHLGVSGADE